MSTYFIFILYLGFGIYCCCFRTNQHNQDVPESRDEQRPLLDRLRLRERLSGRSGTEGVALAPFPLESGEVTPVSVASDDEGSNNPIVREPRARFHRCGSEMRVTLEVRTYTRIKF